MRDHIDLLDRKAALLAELSQIEEKLKYPQEPPVGSVVRILVKYRETDRTTYTYAAVAVTEDDWRVTGRTESLTWAELVAIARKDVLGRAINLMTPFSKIEVVR